MESKETVMKTGKNQFVQLAGTALTLVLILGVLATVWASIIGLFLWAFLLLSSFGGDQASLVLSSIQIDPLTIALSPRESGDLRAICS